MAVSHCDHPICSVCAVRLRLKQKDKNCVVCKQRNDITIVFAGKDIRCFKSFGIVDFSPYPHAISDERMGIVFFKCPEQHRKLDVLSSISCPICNKGQRFPSFDSLQKHCRGIHSKQFCKLCYENRPVFISELEFYNVGKTEFESHMNSPPGALVGAGGNKVGGHPQCRFCGERLFDAASLLQHMRNRHSTCPLCSPTPPLLRFFNADADVACHIRTVHMKCPFCFEGVGQSSGRSFSTPMELATHMKSQHGYSDERQNLVGDDTVENEAADGGRSRGRKATLRSIEMDSSSPDPYQLRRSINVAPFPGSSGIGTSHVPSHMRVAGRVTGTGRFSREEVMSSEDASAVPAVPGRVRSGNRIEDFPNLGARTATGNGIVASEQRVLSDFPSLGVAGLRASQDFPSLGAGGSRTNEQQPVPAAVTAASGRGEKVNVAAQLRCLGLTETAAAGVKKGVSKAEEERRRLEERRRRESRIQSLAGAFGIALPPTQSAGSGGGARPDSSPALLVSRPMYSPNLISWAKEQKTLLQKTEKRLYDLLHSDTDSSLNLKPMDFADRRAIHEYVRYYKATSFEYDNEVRRKYVSVVKAPDSFVPLLPLSAAASAEQHQGFICQVLQSALATETVNLSVAKAPVLVFEAADPVDASFTSQSPPPSVSLLLAALRTVGVLVGDSEVALHPVSPREDGLRPRLIVVGVSWAILEFDSVEEASRANEAFIAAHGLAPSTSSSSRPRVRQPPLPFKVHASFPIPIAVIDKDETTDDWGTEAIPEAPPPEAKSKVLPLPPPLGSQLREGVFQNKFSVLDDWEDDGSFEEVDDSLVGR